MGNTGSYAANAAKAKAETDALYDLGLELRLPMAYQRLIKRLWKKMPRENGYELKLGKFLTAFKFKETRMAIRLFCLIDGETMGADKVFRFPEFVAILWNICAFTDRMIVEWMVNIFDVDDRGGVDRYEMDAMLRMAHELDDVAENPEVAALLDVTHPKRAKDIVSIDQILHKAAEHPKLLEPLISIRKTLRTATFGRKGPLWWHRLAVGRKRRVGLQREVVKQYHEYERTQKELKLKLYLAEQEELARVAAAADAAAARKSMQTRLETASHASGGLQTARHTTGSRTARSSQSNPSKGGPETDRRTVTSAAAGGPGESAQTGRASVAASAQSGAGGNTVASGAASQAGGHDATNVAGGDATSGIEEKASELHTYEDPEADAIADEEAKFDEEISDAAVQLNEAWMRNDIAGIWNSMKIMRSTRHVVTTFKKDLLNQARKRREVVTRLGEAAKLATRGGFAGAGEDSEPSSEDSEVDHEEQSSLSSYVSGMSRDSFSEDYTSPSEEDSDDDRYTRRTSRRFGGSASSGDEYSVASSRSRRKTARSGKKTARTKFSRSKRSAHSDSSDSDSTTISQRRHRDMKARRAAIRKRMRQPVDPAWYLDADGNDHHHDWDVPKSLRQAVHAASKEADALGSKLPEWASERWNWAAEHRFLHSVKKVAIGWQVLDRWRRERRPVEFMVKMRLELGEVRRGIVDATKELDEEWDMKRELDVAEAEERARDKAESYLKMNIVLDQKLQREAKQMAWVMKNFQKMNPDDTTIEIVSKDAAYAKLRKDYIDEQVSKAVEAAEEEYEDLVDQRARLVSYFDNLSREITANKVALHDPMRAGWVGASGWDKGIKFAAVPGKSNRAPLPKATVRQTGDTLEN